MKLYDQVRQKLRILHYSWATEECYVGWIERFVRFHRRGTVWRHPRELGAVEIEEFLGFLACDRHVSASTQNQAFNALLFLYQKVLEIELPPIEALRAQRTRRLPVVLSVDEVRVVSVASALSSAAERRKMVARGEVSEASGTPGMRGPFPTLEPRRGGSKHPRPSPLPPLRGWTGLVADLQGLRCAPPLATILRRSAAEDSVPFGAGGRATHHEMHRRCCFSYPLFSCSPYSRLESRRRRSAKPARL